MKTGNIDWDKVGSIVLLTVRLFLMALSVLVFLAAVIYSTNKYFRTNYRYGAAPITVLQDIPYNDLTDGAIQTRLSLANSVFQVGLLVIAGLGGLLLAREDEAKLVFKDFPEILMLLLAGSSLALSFVCFILYLSEISYLYGVAVKLQDSNPSIPDVLDKSVSYLFALQLVFFFSGLVVALFTFVSTHKLRSSRP